MTTVDFARYVRPGDTVLWGQACAEPRTLTEQLMAQRARIGGFRCFLGVPTSDTVRPEHADHVRFVSYTGSGANRSLDRAGVLDVLPCHYSAFPRLITSGVLPVDVVLLSLPAPDSVGRHSLGLAEEYLPAAIDTARTVIAEVSEAVPWTHGSRTLTAADLDVVIHTSRSPTCPNRDEPDLLQRRIAKTVAGLVEDGSTLQVGIGALPEAVLAELSGHRHLGVHSGLINDRVADLMAAGVVTNARKTLDRGRAVAGALIGSDRLFTFAHRNPAIRLADTRYTHAHATLAAQQRFVAINTAIEVDLTGQTNTEVARGRYVGAVGGAADFLRGAAASPGGLPIVALPAARIVATLSGPVSTARADAGVIVTEFGVADLRGRSLRERYERLLAIVHPDRQAALETSLMG
ncbi:acetyl-CoA hydrolase/transferase family protein [Actinocrispum wychmicini]|uniref:Acyl-CoA hydrolase n=1 Tax=Actinocrispum wychmicini TaxID=1213861 RepID=A0A4R2JXF5_9PSEU|nr:acetyl-CoA hydrolase/transferase C-terminal domain-containing protein [Actinocrispum wychmicini]TCO62026.1 acyl-CoA hydrolase [Actinocrispum wychmicini]